MFPQHWAQKDSLLWQKVITSPTGIVSESHIELLESPSRLGVRILISRFTGDSSRIIRHSITNCSVRRGILREEWPSRPAVNPPQVRCRTREQPGQNGTLEDLMECRSARTYRKGWWCARWPPGSGAKAQI
jgi:hypothetical protein